MKDHTIEITFMWESGANETRTIVITTPDHITTDNVIAALKTNHQHLVSDDDAGIYLDYGKSPDTLVGYVCQKNGWNWKVFFPNASISLSC